MYAEIQDAQTVLPQGFTYLARLRDGEGFNGRARRIARRLGLEQDQRDEDLYRAHGGRLAVESRLLAKINETSQSLLILTTAERRRLRTFVIENARLVPLELRFISKCVGFGVFAAERIRAGDIVGEYTGVLRTARADDTSNRYLAQTEAYGPMDGFFIDGQAEGNLTRFINHGTLTANVSNEHVFHQKRWHRLLRADRDIVIGTQLLWDYGAEYWRDREAPLSL